MRTYHGLDELRETVVSGGYCIGCGACGAFSRGAISIELTEFGEYQAAIPTNAGYDGPDIREVCPFSDLAVDETALAGALFGVDSSFDSNIGYYRGLYAGHVTTGDFRSQGSSGGVGSWIASQLLDKSMVDHVIHVRPGPVGFEFAISSTVADVLAGAKSRYFPIEMSEVLTEVSNRPGRYAIVGLPCFIKAFRLLSRVEPVIAERIRFTVGLVCGHLKSAKFADFLAWQMGVVPGQLKDIDFRHKRPDRPAPDYAVRVESRCGHSEVTPLRELFGHKWGYGLFKYAACDFCDDVMAETADITIGDAWLPDFDQDPMGTNIIVVRTPEFEHLIQEGRRNAELALTEIDATAVAASQAGGLRHRRMGLAYRLFRKDQAGEWRPPKRIAASNTGPRRYQKLQQTRIALRERSRAVYQRAAARNDFGILIQELVPLMRRHDRLAISFAENISRSWLGGFLRFIPKSIRQRLRRMLGLT